MKKSLINLFSMCLLALALIGCSQVEVLPAPFTEDMLVSHTQIAIDTFKSGDMSAFVSLCSEEMTSKVSEQQLRDAYNSVIPDTGSFISMDKQTFSAARGNKGTDLVVVQSEIIYEKQKVIYTVTFDSEYKICGFYIK